MEKPGLSAQRSERKLPPPPKVAPWLLFPHGKDYFGKYHTFYDISDPKKKSVTKFIPELNRQRFWQKPCHQGWVLIVNHRPKDPNFNFGDCYLWNPVSLETIMLPNLKSFTRSLRNFVIDGVLSSPPQTSSGDDNIGKESMVFFLFLVKDGGSDFLIYCHLGDKQWRKHELVDQSIKPRSMFYLKGRLFIIGKSGNLMEIAIQHGSSIDDDEAETLKISERIATPSNFRSVPVAGRLAYLRQTTVMESFGQVFKIDRYYIPRGVFNFLTNVEIGKLDFSSMAWNEVKSLDDYVFFLGCNNHLSCLASDMGLSKGCVYLTQHDEINLYKYDLGDKSVLHCLPCPNLPTPRSFPEWLMINATPRIEDCRRSKTVAENVDKDVGKEGAGEARPSFIDNERLRSCSSDLCPWLVSVRYDQPAYNFVSPKNINENYLMNIPELLKGSTIRFSKDGWLLMSKDETLFFHNPFSGSIVRLPNLPEGEGYFFSGIAFSSSPTSSDCVVFGIGRFSPDEVRTAFIKHGDKDWTNDTCGTIYNNVEFELSFNNPVFHRGAFYCLDFNGSLGVFKFENGTSSWEILARVPRPNCQFIYKSFLVECGGDLLCVLLGRLGKWVRVFRLNDNEMVWVEVKHLGRNMLFISHASSIAAVAPTKQMENKIYFPRLHEDGILFYSLDTGSYHCPGCKHAAKDYGDSKEYLICTWIEPNCSETTSDQHLDWF